LKERIAGAHQEIVRSGRGLGEGGRQPQKETGVGIAGVLNRSGAGARGIETPIAGLAVVQPKSPVAGMAIARSEPYEMAAGLMADLGDRFLGLRLRYAAAADRQVGVAAQLDIDLVAAIVSAGARNFCAQLLHAQRSHRRLVAEGAQVIE